MYASRFFTKEDSKSQQFFYKLHYAWWSRIYEYPWAGGFAEAGDICLDAACGVSHPLKFYLLDHCKEVYANDIDKRLLSRDEMLKEIREVYGESAVLDKKYTTDIKYSTSSITHLPYPDNFFDKVYCISVLEHLKDHFNERKTFSFTQLDNFWGKFFKKDIYRSIQEFKRVLKPGGLIVVTFDYPIINLEYFNEIVRKLGLHFVEKPDFNLPENALYSEHFGLYCFRAVIKK
jgi:SAM-dependent methyltransferase